MGGGKVPLGPCHVEAHEGEHWRLRGLDGEVREYREIVGAGDDRDEILLVRTL